MAGKIRSEELFVKGPFAVAAITVAVAPDFVEYLVISGRLQIVSCFPV
jgi:hypothetical protein